MRQIFLECYSLIYLNLISFKVKNDCIIDKSFDGISDDLIYCMNNDKNSPNFVSALEIHSKKNECGNMCFHESKKIIASKKTCIDNCMNDNVYKTHELKIINRETLYISGVKKIDNFDKSEFIINTIMGNVEVKGANLEVVLLDTDKGDVRIKGKINSIIYIDNKRNDKESILTKLFK